MKSHKPTTPSRRQLTSLDYKAVTTTGISHKALLRPLAKNAGRNNKGRITVRHKGGGNKRLYREIDFRQNKFNVPARVETIEYDPNRNAFIGLVVYKDGERRYIILPEGLLVGNEIVTSEKTEIKAGNRLTLKNIPVGTQIHNIELLPKQGGKIVKAAGSAAIVMGLEGKYAILKMPSGEVRKALSECYASVGAVSNSEFRTINIGKAGRNRWLGIRPTVRGTAMNPCDHPYGGGEGRQPRGTRRPKTLWGKVTGGHKTRRKKKWSNVLILQRRKISK
ncbi:MAG: 50S ribosomal protein L2 [bacterium]|nr:50S ribosomal protein L2 [bacterium]